ncbi:MAG: outer membrane beta-barrel protein [Luteolibacter sp.]
MANIQTSVFAQELAPPVEDRVVASADDSIETAGDEAVPLPPPVVQDDSKKRGGWELGAVISAAYDSNIFLSSSKPESDMVFRIGPTVAYTKGDAKEGEGGFIQLAYRPTSVTYAKNPSDNRIDQQALLTAGWRGKVTQLTYKGSFQQLGDATAETGGQTDRFEFENEVRVAWLPREKVTVELAAGNRQSDYKDPTLFDSSKTYGEVALLFAYSPKTQLGLVYQVARFKVQDSPDQDTQQLTGRIAWQPREKIRINLEGGAEYRKVDRDSQLNPVMEARTEWTPREGTSLYVSAYQKQDASSFYAGQIYKVKGLTAGVSQHLGGNWTARFEGGVEKASYSRVSGSGPSGRRDRIWFVRPALEYKISEDSNIALFYRVSENTSNASDFGYDQQMAGIEFNYKF